MNATAILETKVMEKKKGMQQQQHETCQKHIYFSATCSSPKKINDTTFPVPNL